MYFLFKIKYIYILFWIYILNSFGKLSEVTDLSFFWKIYNSQIYSQFYVWFQEVKRPVFLPMDLYVYKKPNLRPLILGTLVSIIFFKYSSGIPMKNEIQNKKFRFPPLNQSSTSIPDRTKVSGGYIRTSLHQIIYKGRK